MRDSETKEAQQHPLSFNRLAHPLDGLLSPWRLPFRHPGNRQAANKLRRAGATRKIMEFLAFRGRRSSRGFYLGSVSPAWRNSKADTR